MPVAAGARSYPYEYTVWHGVISTRQFNGKWLVKYEFSNEFAGKRPGRAFVYVNDRRTDQFILYDDRMEVYGLSFDAGSSNQLRVLFDWKSGETEAGNWAAANMAGLMLLAASALILGLVWLHNNWDKPGKKMHKFLGAVMLILGMFFLLLFGYLLF